MKNFIEYQKIKTVYFTVATGLALFALGSYFIVKFHGALIIFSPSHLQYFESIVILLSLGGITGGHYYHKKRMDNLSDQLSIKDCLTMYKASFFIKLMILQCIGLITLMGYVMSENKTFMLIFAFQMITVLINYPSENRVSDEIHVERENNESEIDSK